MARRVRCKIKRIELDRTHLMAVLKGVVYDQDSKIPIIVETPSGKEVKVIVSPNTLGRAKKRPGMCKITGSAKRANPGDLIPRITLYLNVHKLTGEILLPDPLP